MNINLISHSENMENIWSPLPESHKSLSQQVESTLLVSTQADILILKNNSRCKLSLK